jgi:hypothetical protein
MLYLGIIKNTYNMKFRSDNEAPVTATEVAIENILVNNGYDASDIQFRILKDNERYLRIGYWQRLNEDIRAQLSGLVVSEFDMYDDDCGYLFSYEIKH